MTAAHRTLPLGALILVTNLTTGQSAAMRINDRGPFVEDRVLDMTIASAKATGIYRAGLAHGAHRRLRDAQIHQLRRPLVRADWRASTPSARPSSSRKSCCATYADSNVIEFPGENSYWVRIRPEGDDRQMAEYIARHLQLNEGTAYLTRLD